MNYTVPDSLHFQLQPSVQEPSVIPSECIPNQLSPRGWLLTYKHHIDTLIFLSTGIFSILFSWSDIIFITQNVGSMLSKWTAHTFFLYSFIFFFSTLLVLMMNSEFKIWQRRMSLICMSISLLSNIGGTIYITLVQNYILSNNTSMKRSSSEPDPDSRHMTWIILLCVQVFILPILLFLFIKYIQWRTTTGANNTTMLNSNEESNYMLYDSVTNNK